MSVVEDAVGCAILPHACEVMEQALLAWLEVHHKAFTDLDPCLKHGVLWTSPLGVMLVDDEVLNKCLSSGPPQDTVNAPRQPDPSTAVPKQPARDKQ